MKVIREATIDKFAPEQNIVLPEGFKLLTIGNQHEKIVFWYECEAEEELSEVGTFISVNTGDKPRD